MVEPFTSWAPRKVDRVSKIGSGFQVTFSNPLSVFEALAESMVTAGMPGGAVSPIGVNVAADIGVGLDVGDMSCCDCGISGDFGLGISLLDGGEG